MAKQSFKDSIYQQIANSQVQQVIKDQRDQDYKLAQDLIAQYQPTNDDITLAQNLIAQYQQPAPQPAPQPEPVATQSQIPVLKKQTGPTKEEKLKAFSENYARQQQEESMLQSAKVNAEKQAKREAAVKAGRDKFFGKEADAVVKQAKVNKVLSEGKKVNPVVGNRINQVDLSQYNLPSDGFTEEEKKTFANAEKAKQWIQPGYKMSKEEQKEAKRIAAEGKQTLAEKYPVTNKADYGKLLDRMTPEDRENYIAFEDLGNKADSFASMSVGAADKAVSMLGGLFDLYALSHPFDPNAARSAKAYEELVQDNWNEKAAISKDLAQNSAPLVENVPIIGEITPYGVGEAATQLGAYMATEDIFNEIGAMASGSSKVGQFLGNQVGQNLQDIALDTEQLVKDLAKDGELSAEDKQKILNNIKGNALGKLFFGGLQEVPGLVKGVGDNIAARNAADAAFRENVRAGADNLSRIANEIPGIEDVDNVVRNATRQAEEATKNIENIAQQIPKLPEENYATDIYKNTEPFSITKDPYYLTQEEFEAGQKRLQDYLNEPSANNKALTENHIKQNSFGPDIDNALNDIQSYIDGFSGEKELHKELTDSLDEVKNAIRNGGDIEGARAKLDNALNSAAEIVQRDNDSLLGDITSEAFSKVKSATDGSVIRLSKSALKDALGDDAIFSDLNNMVYTGKGSIKFREGSGVPIDSIYNELRELSDYELPEAHTEADQVAAIAKYISDVKSKNITPDNSAINEVKRLGNSLDEVIGSYNPNKVMAEKISKPKSDIITSEPIGPGKYEIPDTPENAPKDVPPVDGMKERGTSKHIRNAGTPMKMEDVADEVVADFEDNPDMYRVLKNADTKAKAEKIYAESDNPEVEFRDMLRRHDPAALPLGQQLAKDYSAAGNHAAASQIYREMGEQLTKAGQFSQAAVINMMKNDPLTALNYAERQIDNLNVQGQKRFGNKWKDFSLTDAEKELFNNIKPGDEDAIRAAYDTIGERLGKEYPTSFMDKLLEARKIAMLFNVRTNVRNVLANVPTLGMRWMSDRVDAVGQNIAHLINPDIKVTQSLTGSGIQGRKLAKQVFESDKVQALVNGTTGKYEIPELKNSLVQNKQMYKGTPVSKWIDKVTNGGIQKVNEKLFGKKGVQSGLETIRNATYKMLDLGDSPFVKENFVERLGSYIKAQGIKNIDDIPEEAIQTAWEEAMKATYKDNSWAVQMLKGVKGGLEKIPGVGRAVSQAAIPFLQAPGNIAARMVDYSPVKAGKGIGEIIAGAGKNDVEQVTKGIADAAKGLTGSGLILLGMGLHKAGIITGAYSDDKDQKAYEKQNGFREYALHLGDKYFTYDWAQPFAEPLIVGTLLSEAITKSDEYNSDLLNYLGVDSPVANKALGVAGEGIKASVNSWFGASPLQGLQELMSGGYSGDDIAGNIKKVAMEDFAGAFVPSSVNAVAKSVDNTTRNTYDPSSSTATFVNQQKAKIPVLSKTLPAKYDTWGNEMKNADNKAMAAASKFLIPGDYSYDKGDKIDQEIMRLYEGTNNAAVFPQVAPTAVGDKKLNNKEVSTFQKDMGQRSRALAEDLINNKGYSKLEDTEKAEVLDSLYKVSKAITERDKFGKEPSNTYKKLVEVYDKAGKGKKGQKALVEEVLTKNTLNKYDVTDSESARQILEDHGEKWLEKYGKAKSRLKGESSSAKIESVINAMPSLSKKDKAEMYSYLKPSTTPGSNPYGYVPGISYDPKEDKTYQKAKAIIPSMSPEKYYETYDKIDTNGNNSISQDELYQYFEANSNLQDAYIDQLWEAYGGYTNKKGEKKKLIRNADGSYTSSY